MQKKTPSLANLTRIVERGFAAVADDITRLATKEDIARIEEHLYSIEQELKDIKKRLAKLEDNYEAVQAHGDDIRELRERVKAIEKQLAMRR